MGARSIATGDNMLFRNRADATRPRHPQPRHSSYTLTSPHFVIPAQAGIHLALGTESAWTIDGSRPAPGWRSNCVSTSTRPNQSA